MNRIDTTIYVEAMPPREPLATREDIVCAADLKRASLLDAVLMYAAFVATAWLCVWFVIRFSGVF